MGLKMKKSAEMSVILVLLVLLPVIKVDGFNLSPQPNYVFREPALNIYMNKNDCVPASKFRVRYHSTDSPVVWCGAIDGDGVVATARHGTTFK